MLLFDPSTHEHFQSVDSFIEHICASAPGLEEKLAMTQAWHKASVRMHVDDLMASVHSGDRGSGPLRKRCGDTVDHIVCISLRIRETRSRGLRSPRATGQKSISGGKSIR